MSLDVGLRQHEVAYLTREDREKILAGTSLRDQSIDRFRALRRGRPEQLSKRVVQALGLVAGDGHPNLGDGKRPSPGEGHQLVEL